MSIQNDNEEKQIGNYILINQIGSGGFAKVYLAFHIPTSEKVAIKILNKSLLRKDPENAERLKKEIEILKLVKHKNIVRLYEVMETPQKIYLVMELCENGELFDYILEHQNLDEKKALKIFQEIINGIEYLHKQNIVHRDIKPENMLLDSDYSIKLIDFGISTQYSNSELLSTPCGTVVYAPPEMHRGNKYCGLLSDVWSCGVVLYAMVCGYLPFGEENEEINISNIINGVFEIPSFISPELKDLLIHILDKDPYQRYDIDQIKNHSWFNLTKPRMRDGIIVGYNNIPVDNEVIKKCAKEYHGNSAKIKKSVKNNLFDENSALYYIVLKKMIREDRYQSISDLVSTKYFNYLICDKALNHSETESKKLECSFVNHGRKSSFNFPVSKKIQTNLSIEQPNENRVPLPIKMLPRRTKQKKHLLSLSSCYTKPQATKSTQSTTCQSKSKQTIATVSTKHTVIHNRNASAVDNSMSISLMQHPASKSSARTNSSNCKGKKFKATLYKNQHPVQLFKLSLKLNEDKVNNTAREIVKSNNKEKKKDKKEIQVYNGIVDINCITTLKLNEVIEKITAYLKKKNATFTKLSPYKIHCSKHGTVCSIEVLKLENTLRNECDLYYLVVKNRQGVIQGNMKNLIKNIFD